MSRSSHDTEPKQKSWKVFIHDLKNTYIPILNFFENKQSLIPDEQNLLNKLKTYHGKVTQELEKIKSGDSNKMDVNEKQNLTSALIAELAPLLTAADLHVTSYVAQLAQASNANTSNAELKEAELMKQFLSKEQKRLPTLATAENIEPQSLSTMTQDAAKTASKNTISTRVADNIQGKMVKGEYVQLIQSILQNCISNSNDFCTNGNINIRIGLTTRASNNDTLQIIIEDTGPGIPDKVLKKLNSGEDVTKADQSDYSDNLKKRESNGIGISGLRELAVQNGGRLIVTSQMGHGSAFTWELPAQSVLTESLSVKKMQTRAAALEAAALTSSHPDKLIIYFIDDTLVNQKMGKRHVDNALIKCKREILNAEY